MAFSTEPLKFLTKLNICLVWNCTFEELCIHHSPVDSLSFFFIFDKWDWKNCLHNICILFFNPSLIACIIYILFSLKFCIISLYRVVRSSFCKEKLLLQIFLWLLNLLSFYKNTNKDFCFLCRINEKQLNSSSLH